MIAQWWRLRRLLREIIAMGGAHTLWFVCVRFRLRLLEIALVLFSILRGKR